MMQSCLTSQSEANSPAFLTLRQLVTWDHKVDLTQPFKILVRNANVKPPVFRKVMLITTPQSAVCAQNISDLENKFTLAVTHTTLVGLSLHFINTRIYKTFHAAQSIVFFPIYWLRLAVSRSRSESEMLASRGISLRSSHGELV